MGCRSRAERLEPPAVVVEQGRLFLRAGDRDSEIVILCEAERCLSEALEDLLYLFDANRFAMDLAIMATSSPSARNWSAPTQSRPIAASML